MVVVVGVVGEGERGQGNLTQSLRATSCSSGESNRNPSGNSEPWSVLLSQGTTRVTRGGRDGGEGDEEEEAEEVSLPPAAAAAADAAAVPSSSSSSPSSSAFRSRVQPSSLAKNAARSVGLTAVPVIQGGAAVETTASLRPGARRSSRGACGVG